MYESQTNYPTDVVGNCRLIGRIALKVDMGSNPISLD